MHVAAAALCLTSIIFRRVKKMRPGRDHLIMTLILWNLLITGAISAVKEWVIYYDMPQRLLICEAQSYLYFILHNLLAPGFALYIMYVNGAAKNRSRRYYVLFWVPTMVVEIMSVTNPLLGLVYSYDESGEYHRATGMIVLYAVAAAYFLYTAYTMVRTWKILRNRYMNGFQIYLFIIFAGVVVQALFPEIQLEVVCDVFAAVGMMLAFDCNDGLVDARTGLANRAKYDINVRLYENYHYRYNVISVKLLNLSYFEKLMTPELYDRLVTSLAEEFIAVKDGAELYRYSKNTFIMLKADRTKAEKTVDALEDYLSRTRYIKEYKVNLKALICLAKVPDDIESADSHMQLAEYQPASTNRQVTVLKSKGLEFIKRDMQVAAAVHKAVRDRLFAVHYQPIVDSSKNKIISCEALCRLYDDDLGNVSPGEFIPVAEKNGNIIEIGYIVFENVCRDISERELWNLGIEYVEVNLSLYQLMSKDLTKRLCEIADRYGVPTSMINLELTESASANEVPDFSDVILQLMKEGFSFSLDDYGTAYSNIVRAASVAYRNIKIDSSILWAADDDSNLKKILISTIRTFRNLGTNVVQEGVETRAQLDTVTGAGANMVQGYYYSKPLPLREFAQFVHDFNSRADS